MKHHKWLSFGTLFFLAGIAINSRAAETTATSKDKLIYTCTFTPKGWDANDWMFVRRRDMHNFDEWVQKDDHIQNPSGGPDDHTSMLYKGKLRGDLTISATLAFAERQAPSIILASRISDGAQGKEYDAHIEIVAWYQGINVWTHHTVDGKPVWQQAAFARFKLDKDNRYQLQVIKKGKELTISIDGHTFGYVENALTDEFYAGITGSEGSTRFYDFAISSNDK